MTLSVVVITRSRPELLKKCVESILCALPDNGTLHVVVNGPCPATSRYLGSLGSTRIVTREIALTSRCTARNWALSRVDGDIVHFLDDDVVIPRHLFAEIIGVFASTPSVAVVGGPNLTPLDSTFAQKCFGAVLETPLGAPKVRVRYRESSRPILRSADQHDLILCNLAVRKKLVWPALGFDSQITSNEENLFVHGCRGRGLEILYCSNAFVYHHRRATLAGFLAQIASYGRGRGEQMARFPASNHPLFAVIACLPLLATLWLIALASSGQVALVAALYAGACLISAGHSPSARRLGYRGIVAVLLLQPALHIVFSLALWKGMTRGIRVGSVLCLSSDATETGFANPRSISEPA